MTRHEVASRLQEAGIEEYLLEANLLFSRYSGKNMAYLYAHKEEECQNKELEDAIERRISKEPLAYILGEVDFYHETYIVNPHVLIPRQDTEVLVEKAIEILPQSSRFADFCTGSGCVAISVLASRKDAQADLYDIDEEALKVAKENAIKNEVDQRTNFFRRDLLIYKDFPCHYALITANPPYIKGKDMGALQEEVKKEPYHALYGGENGLKFYEKFLTLYKKETDAFLFEIGYDEGFDIKELAEKFGYECKIYKDYSGNDRVAYLIPKKENCHGKI